MIQEIQNQKNEAETLRTALQKVDEKIQLLKQEHEKMVQEKNRIILELNARIYAISILERITLPTDFLKPENE